MLAVKANHGGRTHDARVWSSSRLSRHMLREYENGRRNIWLIGIHNVHIFNFYP